MDKGIQIIGSKPVGLKGRIAGLIMNLIHHNQYNRIIKQIMEGVESPGTMKILDLGCGGGRIRISGLEALKIIFYHSGRGYEVALEKIIVFDLHDFSCMFLYNLLTGKS